MCQIVSTWSGMGMSESEMLPDPLKSSVIAELVNIFSCVDNITEELFSN